MSHPSLTHTEQECPENLIKRKTHNQQNSNEGHEYLESCVIQSYLVYTSLYDMALELRLYFHLLMEKPLGGYSQIRSSHYQAVPCNQKTPITVSSRWQVRSDKAKNRLASTIITATSSVHPHRPFSTDRTIKSDLVLTNPVWKDGVRGWSM